MRPFILLLALLCGLNAYASKSSEPEVGTTPPNFKTKNAVTGEPIELAAYHGQVVVVTFWATWCGPCRKELPILENLQEKLPPETLRVIAISFQEDPGAFKPIKKAAADWKITLAEDRTGKIAHAYDIHTIPHMFIIGRDGKVAAVRVGYGESSVQELVDDVNAVLKNPQDAEEHSTE